MLRILLCLGCLAALGACNSEPVEAPNRATGLITAIEPSDSAAQPTSFTLETDADTYEIRIATDVDYGFDLAHLHEHKTEEDPVEVEIEQRDDELFALAINDA